MHQTPEHRRRKLRPAHASKLAERFRVDAAQLGNGCIDSSRKRPEEQRDVSLPNFIPLRPKRSKLFG
jgi:hypothetical protein